MATNESTKRSTFKFITADTYLEDGGELAKAVLVFAAGDIENAAHELLNQARVVEFSGETTAGSLIRTLAARILAMNSLTLSYIGPDIVTLADAFKAVHGYTLGMELLKDELSRCVTDSEDADVSPGSAKARNKSAQALA